MTHESSGPGIARMFLSYVFGTYIFKDFFLPAYNMLHIG